MGKFDSNASEKKLDKFGNDYNTITLGELFRLEPDSKCKDDAPAIIPSSYFGFDARSHETQRRSGSYVALAGDIDKGSPSIKIVESVVHRYVGEGVAFLIYSSSSASVDINKWRVVIPLEQPCSFKVWQDLQEAFFEFMESEGLIMDRALVRAAQPVYLPNVPLNKRDLDGKPLFYESLIVDGKGLTLSSPNVASFLNSLSEKLALDQAAKSGRFAAMQKVQVRKSHSGWSVIERFNQTHAIDELLKVCGYKKHSFNLWRSRYQQSNSYATINYGESWVSLSESDASAGLGQRCDCGCFGDAFDLFCHYEHGGNFAMAVRAAALSLGINNSLNTPDQAPVSNFSEASIDHELGEATTLRNGDSSPEESDHDEETLETELKPLDLDLLAKTTPQPAPHFIEDWLPKGGVTLLHSHGGVGKSFIANIEAAVCLAAGIEWFGKRTERCKVAVISCEDPVNIIHLRLVAVCKKHRLDISSLKDWLFIFDATDLDMLLSETDGGRSGKLKTTEAYKRLRKFCQRNVIDVLIVDNASDTFGGDEVIRQQVKTFMRGMLLKLVKTRNGSVLLLSHDSKNGSIGRDGGESYSGNTAWHNSARKRWSLKRNGDGVVCLKDEKSNWGSSGGEILLSWDTATETFVQARDASVSPANAILEAQDLNLVLRAIKDAEDDFSLSLSTNSKGFVHKILSQSPYLRNRKWPKGEISRICTKAIHDGLLSNSIEKTKNRNQTERIRLTDVGLAAIAELKHKEISHEDS
jgi:RecA-family ATPase